MKIASLAVIVTLAAVVLLPSPAFAQCPSPDGFGFPLGCCTPATPTIPTFPTMTVNGLGACILDCGVESQYNITATIAPTQVLCDYWLMGLTITAPTYTVGTPTLVAKYARTWVEFPLPGTPPIQVWRFLVNGDLNYGPSTTSAGGCPIPLSALPPYNLPVHFVGNVDYAFNCATGGFQIAFTLTHLCPPEMHAPFSARPIAAAAGWPKRTYHFVGPANFVFGLCPPPDGPIIAESGRASTGLTIPGPYTCLRESQINQGNLQNVFSNCACADPTPVIPPPRYTHQSLVSFENCAGVSAPIMSFPGFGIPFMPTGLRALSIGSYVPTAAGFGYPGPECVSVYLGILDSPGVCGPPTTGPVLHAVTGIGTTGGFPVMLFDAPTPGLAPLDFLDLTEMLVLTPAGFFPGIGALFASEKVWNFNML